MIVVGKPGSGKTSLIKGLLTDENYYYKKFDQILLVSPSANKMGVPVKKGNKNTEFSMSWIENKLMEFN